MKGQGKLFTELKVEFQREASLYINRPEQMSLFPVQEIIYNYW